MSATTTLIGNATSDPELRFTQNGKPVASVTIAVSDRKFDKQRNEYVDGDTWFARCTIWGDMAEHAASSIHKGSRVIGFGRIIQREFEDRDGNKRSSVEVTLDEIGPSLRYATAQVTRKEAGGGSRSPAPSTSTPDDVWSTPSNYSDETPF